ncbi:DUF1297 domain-containing protein [Thermococcus peptonophilus]|uniref:DUF1297 domain-containing protein n=1 Tax=Thermococcus peptonophilus TaxID=53952 RepID=UPI0034652C24
MNRRGLSARSPPLRLRRLFQGDRYSIAHRRGGSNADHWYSELYWGGERLSMGRRIARELKLAEDEDRLEEVVT